MMKESYHNHSRQSKEEDDVTFLTERAQRSKPSSTMRLAAQARELKAVGKPIISLTLGELDTDTPDFAKQGALSAISAGVTKYPPISGIPELKEVVRNIYAARGLHYTDQQTLISVGAKQLLFNAMMATLNSGDEVIFPAPYWVSYPAIVELMGGRPVPILPQESVHSLKLTPETLENAITSRTKWLILNSPSNPSGAVYTHEELRALGRVLVRHPHVWVLADEIYEHLTYSTDRAPSFGESCPALQDRLLIVSGVSKTYAMTGWRIGYGVGPQNLMKALTNIQSQQTSGACSIAQHAAFAALNGSPQWLKDLKSTLTVKRNLMLTFLEKILKWPCPMPAGAFYIFPSCISLFGCITPGGQTLKTDEDVCTYLLEAANVALVPGSGFGMAGHIRISYAASIADLETACTRIHEVIKLLTK
jgi:aspartate aminotransferase